MELVVNLMAFMVYFCAMRGNKEKALVGKLQAVSLYHEHWMGLSLPFGHVRIKAVRQGIKRTYVEAGNQPKVRRPLTWEMIRSRS